MTSVLAGDCKNTQEKIEHFLALRISLRFGWNTLLTFLTFTKIRRYFKTDRILIRKINLFA